MKCVFFKLILFFIILCISYFIYNRYYLVVSADSDGTFRNVYFDDSIVRECSVSEIKSFFDTEQFVEYEIDNSFYFKNFELRQEYNKIGTCSIVSLSMLLCYYDTFYNDNIVKDSITYIDRFGIEKSISTMQNGEFDNCIDYRYSNASLGPTKAFHDYLLDLMIRHNIKELVPECDSNGNYLYDNEGNIKYVTGGISDSEVNEIFTKYCIENNINNNLLSFSSNICSSEAKLLKLLDNGIPLELSISDYTYFYTYGGEPRGKKIENANHSVVCYGYVKTDNGIYLKVHLGYDNDDIIDEMNQFYVNINSVGYYSYYSFDFNNNHICSTNYVYKNNSNSNFIVEICPCHDLTYYFEHNFITDSNNNLKHKFFLKQNYDFSIETDHEFYFENMQLSSHSKKCIYFEFCNCIGITEHEYDNNVKSYGYEINDGHYYFCSECKISKLTEHKIVIETFNNYKHRLKCRICDFKVLETHSSIFNGKLEEHFRSCNMCNDIFEEEHNLLYSEYTNTLHLIDCSCGFVDYENHEYNENFVCNYCNYVHSMHYFYDFDKVNNLFHYKKCLCGYIESERHSFKDFLGGSKCSLCGFITNGGVVLNSKFENEIILKISDLNYCYNRREDEFNEKIK